MRCIPQSPSIYRILLFGLACAVFLPLNGQNSLRFRYQHYKGQQYRIIAQVDEQVLRNRKRIYNTQILNRIAVKVDAMAGQNAQLAVQYQISEQAGRFFSWARESETRFEMSPLGSYQNLPPGASLPSLRNVPSFPDRELRPGEGWRTQGTELQDLSTVFGHPITLRFDFPVDYLYRGKEFRQGRKLDRVTIMYSYSKDVSRQLGTAPRETDIPRSVKARHSIELYWDSELGLPAFQAEEFSVAYLMQSGDEVEFRGRSRGKIERTEPMPDIQQNMKRELEKAGIAAQVERNDKGISISLNSINFRPNSDQILPDEERKLAQISRILQKYPSRDILVTGHTADWGKQKAQQQLSEERAAAVAEFLIQGRLRSREQIVIRGAGATQPIASNKTEEGRRQNRRVEITLLEN